MKILHTIFFVLLFLTSPAIAEKIGGVQLDRSANKLCPAEIFDNSVEGVFYEGNKAMLAFRVSWDNDKQACYAWLNKQPQWGINDVGSGSGKVRKVGGNLRFENANIFVTFNLKTSEAQYQRRNSKSKTLGKLFHN